jgi:ABC-type lipoprotein release transport system permease subunit
MGALIHSLIPAFASALGFSVWQYIAAFALGVAAALAAAAAPIVRESRKSLRERLSDNIRAVKLQKPLFIALSAVLAVLSAVGLNFSPNFLVVPLVIVLVGSIAALLASAMPYVVKFFALILGKARTTGTAALASKTISRNPHTKNITVLASAVIIFTFVVTGAINAVISAITPYNSRVSADFVVTARGGNDSAALGAYTDGIRAIEGVSSAGFSAKYEFAVGGSAKKATRGNLFYAHAVEGSSALSFFNIGGDLGARFDEYEHPIIINYDLSKRHGWKVGDKIKPYHTEQFGFYFTVAGIDYVANENNRTSIVKFASVEAAGLLAEGAEIFVSVAHGADGDRVWRALKRYTEVDAQKPDSALYVLAYRDWLYAGVQGLAGVPVMLRIVQLALCAVAAVGLINLAAVTAIARKREFGILKAAGMDAKGAAKHAIWEGLIAAFAAGGAALALSLLLNRIFPVLHALVDNFAAVSFFPPAVFVSALVAVPVITAVWLLPRLMTND